MKKTIVLCSLAIFIIFLTAVSTQANDLEYPWHTYGNISHYSGGDQDSPGTKFDGYFEQGIDWFSFSEYQLTFNTFIGINGVISDQSERWWDNYIGPSIGFKFKLPVEYSSDASGSFTLGVRGEYFRYLDDNIAPNDTDTRLVFFFGWYAGGK